MIKIKSDDYMLKLVMIMMIMRNENITQITVHVLL